MKRLLSITCILMAISACSSTQVENILNDVESYISERPDSALTTLDSIDRSLLKSPKTKSHHALLYAMALDKNYVNVSDDSLAVVALEHFDKHGDKKYKARALYYLGLSYYYSHEYDKAILEFTKAEDTAKKCDSLYLGMTKIAQADTYAMTYNDIEEYKCLLESNKVFKSISADYYIDVSKYRIAKSLMNQGCYIQSDSIFHEILETASIDHKIKSASIINYAYSLATRPECNNYSAVKLYEIALNEYDSSFMSMSDYWAFAYSLYCTNRIDESNDIINQLLAVDSSGTADYWQYRIAKENSSYQFALNHLEKASNKNEEEISTVLKQSLALLQRDFYNTQAEFALFKMENRTILLICVNLIFIAILGYVLLLIKRIKNKQNEEKEKYLQYAAEITRQLESARIESKDSLKQKFISLYKSKFEVLRLLCDQYLQTENRIDAEKIIYKKVVALVDDIRNDKEHRKKFEAMLDKDLHGIMTNLRNEMPKLKEIDYAIFSYWIIGFDATTMSRLLETSHNIIYIRKTRLKQNIQEKKPNHMQQYLSLMV